MSYVVNTDTVEFYRGRQDYSGGVPVTVCGVPTVPATEDPYIQRKPLLGSRSTARAGHRGVSGRNQHQPSPRPRSTFDQLSFRGTDRSVRRFPRHRGTGKELRLEVLHRNGVIVGDDTASPYPRGVSVLPGRLLVQAGGFMPSLPVAVALRLPLRPTVAGHLPLSTREFGGAPLPMPEIRQIMVGVGCGRGRGYTPVDPDTAGRDRKRVDRSAYDERGVPVAEAVSVDADRGWCAGQFPRPHHGDADAFRQGQTTTADTEPARRVFQRRQSLLAGLHDRQAAALHLERLVQRSRVGAQRLLLGDLRSLTQPCGAGARFGEHLRQAREVGFTALTPLMDGFVPQESATMPFGFERARRVRAGAQTVGVAHYFLHTKSYTAPIIELETMPDHVQLLVSCDPEFGIHRRVKQIKGRSSRVCPPCGPIRTSSPLSAAQPWRQ